MADDEHDPSTTRFLRWFASVTPRRTFLGQLGKGFAWLLGAGIVGRAPSVWDPLGVATARADNPQAPCHGPYPPIGVCAPNLTPNPHYGNNDGDGCVRPDQQGQFGCDCTCMYGSNTNCPNGDNAPGGGVWCETVMLPPPRGSRELCYADCFSSGASHGSPSTCMNGSGRNCWCTGNKEGEGQSQWPPGSYGNYDCTRVINYGPGDEQTGHKIDPGMPGSSFCP